MKSIYTIIAVLFSIALTGQGVVFTIQNQTFEPGDTVRAEFRASGFTDIGAVQFVMKADTGNLQFDGFEFPEDSPFGIGSFSWDGLPGYAFQPGEIRCVWISTYGSTVSENSPIFTAVFVAKGSSDLATAFKLWYNHHDLKPIAYYADPTEYVTLTVAYVDEVTADVEPQNGIGLSVYPNPAPGNIVVYVLCEQPQRITINLVESAGYTVFGQRFDHGGGVESYEIQAPFPGLYVVRVNSDSFVNTRKVLKN